MKRSRVGSVWSDYRRFKKVGEGVYEIKFSPYIRPAFLSVVTIFLLTAIGQFLFWPEVQQGGVLMLLFAIILGSYLFREPIDRRLTVHGGRRIVFDQQFKGFRWQRAQVSMDDVLGMVWTHDSETGGRWGELILKVNGQEDFHMGMAHAKDLAPLMKAIDCELQINGSKEMQREIFGLDGK